MKSDPLYEERVSSPWTQALFSALTFLFFILLVRRTAATTLDPLGLAFFVLFVVFLFYSLNYRMLIIHLTPDALSLKFGIFRWTIPLDNIQECRLDHIPWLVRYGGAGIHFMSVRGRYRASLNFLEHPRVVIELRRRAGLVREVSFSTRQPEVVLGLLREAVSRKGISQKP